MKLIGKNSFKIFDYMFKKEIWLFIKKNQQFFNYKLTRTNFAYLKNMVYK